MKIGNRQFTEPYTVLEVIPRADGPVVFKAQAVLDTSAFDALCPRPRPPIVQRPGQASIQNVEDATFKTKVLDYSQKRMNWLVLESLKATPDLVWEKVILEKPETWGLWTEELKEAKFTEIEITRIFNAVFKANSLDESHLENARKDFLASEALKNLSISPMDGQQNTPSGEPVSVTA